jgi:signal transduction histidine kinase
VTSSVLVLALSTLLSIVAVRQLLLAQLRDEIERSLVKEIGEFRSVLQRDVDSDDDAPGNTLAAVFDTYLSQNIPSEGEEVLAMIGGEPYLSERAHDAGLPLQTLERELDRWGALDAPEQGVLQTSVGEMLFIAEPVSVSGERIGTLVIANSPEFEIGEIHDVTRTMAIVGAVVVAMGSILAWFAAGRVVAPIGGLTRAARSIDEGDLTRRIEVKGTDEVAELSQTFNHMLDRLEQAFTTQRQFVDDAGHELRTPITIVRGHLELMGDDPRDRAETVALVMGELSRMDRIVNDLLLLANARRTDFVQAEVVDLAELTTELHAKAGVIADREWRLDEVGRGRFLLDRQRVTQAVLQLAANAAVHTTGGPITIGSSAGSDGIRIWVRDTGPGIDAERRAHIFERFARGDGPRQSNGGGLGLPIVKAIAEAHGGTVAVESVPGEGSTFTLLLPVAAVRDDQELLAGHPHPKVQA